MPTSKVTQVMLETIDGVDFALSKRELDASIPTEAHLCLMCQGWLIEQVLKISKDEKSRVSAMLPRHKKLVGYHLLAANAFFPLAIEIALMLHKSDPVRGEKAVQKIFLEAFTRTKAAANSAVAVTRSESGRARVRIHNQ